MTYDLQNHIYDYIHPLLAYAVKEALMQVNGLGMPFEVFEGLRRPERSHDLFIQGRELQAGIWVVVDKKKIVTNADAWCSWHNFGLAVDIVLDASDKPGLQPSWQDFVDANKDKLNDWTMLGTMGMAQGLAWGGSRKPDGTPVFGIIDVPHFQLTRGLDIKTAKQIVDQQGMPALWKYIDEAA